MPFRVTHNYGIWQVYPPRHSSKSYAHPTAQDFARLAKSAPYRVIWPAALPASAKLESLDADASEMFTLLYACPHSLSGYSAVVIIPKNYAAISPNLGKWFESQSIPHGRIVKWSVGDKSMLLESTCMTPAQMARVRTATIAAGGP